MEGEYQTELFLKTFLLQKLIISINENWVNLDFDLLVQIVAFQWLLLTNLFTSDSQNFSENVASVAGLHLHHTKLHSCKWNFSPHGSRVGCSNVSSCGRHFQLRRDLLRGAGHSKSIKLVKLFFGSSKSNFKSKCGFIVDFGRVNKEYSLLFSKLLNVPNGTDKKWKWVRICNLLNSAFVLSCVEFFYLERFFGKQFKFYFMCLENMDPFQHTRQNTIISFAYQFCYSF